MIYITKISMLTAVALVVNWTKNVSGWIHVSLLHMYPGNNKPEFSKCHYCMTFIRHFLCYICELHPKIVRSQGPRPLTTKNHFIFESKLTFVLHLKKFPSLEIRLKRKGGINNPKTWCLWPQLWPAQRHEKGLILFIYNLCQCNPWYHQVLFTLI